MGRPKKYASAADRTAAYKARKSNVTVKAPSNVTFSGDETHNVTGEVVSAATAAAPVTGLPPVRHQSHVPLSIFAGRGSPRTYQGQSYVLIARSVQALVAGQCTDDAYAVIPAADWEARLDHRCAHGLQGWACHAC